MQCRRWHLAWQVPKSASARCDEVVSGSRASEDVAFNAGAEIAEKTIGRIVGSSGLVYELRCRISRSFPRSGRHRAVYACRRTALFGAGGLSWKVYHEASAGPPSVSKVEPADWRGVRLENLLGTTPAVEVRQGGREIELPGRSAAILSVSGVYY